MKGLKYPLYLVIFCAFVVLLWSVVKSGYYFQFNSDEVYHANTIYLMLKGFKPYVDFYSVYSPFLNWFLTPIYHIFGFNFQAIYASRLFMVAVYVIKLVLIFLLARKVFNNRIAVLSVFFFLLDPFMVFAGMQIRPENLMMMFYLLFLIIAAYAFSLHSYKLFFLTGILFGLTFLTNLKILPSLGAFGAVFLYYTVKEKKFQQFLMFMNGFCLTVLVFFGYYLIKGYLPEMFLHIFLDPFKLNNAIQNPTWLGYFYFTNQTIYGIGGPTINWMYAWMLPVLGFAGGYFSLFHPYNSARFKSEAVFKFILFFSMVLQWVAMLFTNSVFIQYYIPLNWFYAVFSAVVFYNLLFETKVDYILKTGIFLVSIVLLFCLIKVSVQANLNRSEWRENTTMNDLTEVWKLIPPDTPTFPDVVFRKPIYPILWGGTLVKYMVDRYPPAYLAIEKYKIPIMVDLTDELYFNLDPETQHYISTYYVKDELNPRIRRRKK